MNSVRQARSPPPPPPLVSAPPASSPVQAPNSPSLSAASTSVTSSSSSSSSASSGVGNVHIYLAPVPDSPFDECVYDLVPVRIVPAERPPRYVSRYHELARNEYRSGLRPMASMGPLRVIVGKPQEYLRKGAGEAFASPHSPPGVSASPRNAERRKAPLPDTPGTLKTRTQLDFVASNRATMARSKPPEGPPAPRKYLAKACYGRPPIYPEPPSPVPKVPAKHGGASTAAAVDAAAAAAAANNNNNISNDGGEHGGRLIALPENERALILEGLRANWERLNGEYQRLSLTVDTVPKINRKLHIEQQLKNVEDDIRRFAHERIYVRTDA